MLSNLRLNPKADNGGWPHVGWHAANRVEQMELKRTYLILKENYHAKWLLDRSRITFITAPACGYGFRAPLALGRREAPIRALAAPE